MSTTPTHPSGHPSDHPSGQPTGDPTGYPEQPMLPGQAAAPPGPCDLTGMYVMHHAFRRDLRRVRGAAAHTPLGDVAAWQALAAWWGRLGSYLHEHHAKEDEALWPLLLERVDAAGDTEGRALLEAMESEHAAIDPALEAVGVLLDMLAGAAAAPQVREQLVLEADAAEQLLDAHLAHEETEAVALLQRHVDGEEWTRLERSRLAQKPGPRELLLFLPWIADELDEQVLAHLLGGAAPVRWLLALGRRGYARRRAVAFAHLPQK